MAEQTSSGVGAPPSVIIAGARFSYPHGTGASARVRAYARGLLESGARVHVVSLHPPPQDGVPADSNLALGVHEGVSFEYSCGTHQRADTFLGRRLLELRSPLRLWLATRRFFAHQPGPKAIIAYESRSTWIVYLALLAHRYSGACLLELCEMPFVYEEDSSWIPLRRWVMESFSFRFVDGFIAISAILGEYARAHGRPQVPVAHVPILVVTSDFRAARSPARRFRDIVYVGDMRWHEGEVTDLLAAFAIVAREESDVVLKLVGPASAAGMGALRAYADELGCGDRLEFTGVVKRDALPGILDRAAMLVLIRRAGLFSEAGLPTKLGEYLASGRPVVVTATGDIPLYLTHGETAYLVASGDPRAFAAQMSHVLRNEEEARCVGARGRLLAESKFDYRRHGVRLNRFVTDCVSAMADRRTPAARQ